MRLADLDVPVGPEDLGGALDQLREQRDAKRGVRRAQDRDLARCFVDPLAGGLVEPGGADQDRDPGRNRAFKAGLERRSGGEVDEHVAMILVDQEARILSSRRGDRLAHAPVRGDQADPDRLLGGAHQPVMAKAGAPRNGSAPV